jgi:hypothetical protein
MFRIVFWDVLPCKMEAVRTSETSVDNYFTRQYIPEDNSEHHTRRRDNVKSHNYSSDSIGAKYRCSSLLRALISQNIFLYEV